MKIFWVAIATLVLISISCDMVGFIVYGEYPYWSPIGSHWVGWGQGVLLLVIFLLFSVRIIRPYDNK